MINIQNIDDNECLKWCLVRYLHPADHNPTRITKADKDFSKRINFKDIKFPVKTRDIYKIEKNNSICISVFDHKNKKKKSNFLIKKMLSRKTCWFIIIGEEGKRHCILSQDFNAFMYNSNLHRGRKYFPRDCLQAFNTEKILKHRFKGCFNFNGKQSIIMPKKDKHIKFKYSERKIKSPFNKVTIYDLGRL